MSHYTHGPDGKRVELRARRTRQEDEFQYGWNFIEFYLDAKTDTMYGVMKWEEDQ